MANVCEQVKRDLVDDVQRAVNGVVEREYGFIVCDADGEFVAGKGCSGTNCSIQLRDCRGMREVGDFHVHPQPRWASERDFDKVTQPMFSAADIRESYQKGLAFSCVVSKTQPDLLHCIKYPSRDDAEFAKKIAITEAVEAGLSSFKRKQPEASTVKHRYTIRFKPYICEAKL